MPRRQEATSIDYGKPYRFPAVAAANRLGGALDRAGIAPVGLSEGSLIAAAERSTGLRCFSGDELRVPLRRLLESLEGEARLHLVGRLIARGNLVRILSNRLRVDAAIDRHPEILDHEIDPPLIIVGLQRTATTLLQRLLSMDPGFRFLPSWEALNPASFKPLDDGVGDSRRRFARLAERSVSLLGPDFRAVHPVDVESPEEDCLLLDLTFMSQTFEATQQVPSFMAWRERADHGPAYLYYAKMLRYLHWRRPTGTWLLKTPSHLEHLDVLLEALPGSRFLFLHRDPQVAIASYCSMMCHAYGMFTDHVDAAEVGRRWLRKDALMMRRALEVRDRVGEGSFLDVSHYDLVKDPLAEVRRIYEWLGAPLARGGEDTMGAYFADNPKHKHGRHRYALSTFGLEPADVEEAFGDYRARFDVPFE